MHRTTTSITFAAAFALAATGLSAFAAPAPTAPAAESSATDSSAGPRQNFRGPMRERMERREQRGDQRGDRRPQIDRHLTTEQVRDIVEGRLALSGNPNLKVGKVTVKEEGVVSVEIVTKTGALVDTNEISTRSGMPAAVEKARAAARERGPGGRRFAGGPNGGPNGGKDLKLSVDQARKLAEARLIIRGNPNLKVGPVKEKDADTITVDIVASDNSLVSQREIDRHTGRPKRNRT